MQDSNLTPEHLRARIFFWTTIAYTAMCLLSLVIFWFNPPPSYLWATTGMALLLSVAMIFQTWPHRNDKMLTTRLHRLALGYLLAINCLVVSVVALDHLNGFVAKAWILVWFVPINLALTAAMVGAGLALIVAGLDFALILLVAFSNNTIILPAASYVLVVTLSWLSGYWGGTRILKTFRDERHLDVYFTSQSEAHRYEIETLGRDNEALEEANGDLRIENAGLQKEIDTLRVALEACQRQHHRTGVLVDTKIERSKGIVNFKFMNIEGERLPARMTLTHYRDLEIGGGEAITATDYLHKTDSGGMYLFIKKAQKA